MQQDYPQGRDAAEAVLAIGVLQMDAIQKQHIRVDIQIKGRAETLDQGDGAGVGISP